MEPTIITLKLLLAGYETPVDLNADFSPALDALRARARGRLGHLDGRPIGFWTGDPCVDYTNPANHSRRIYFFGLQAPSPEGLPADCAVRDLPQSAFAVFRESMRGTAPKWAWLEKSGYAFNADAIPGDLERFDDWDHTGADQPCDILMPVIKKEG